MSSFFYAPALLLALGWLDGWRPVALAAAVLAGALLVALLAHYVLYAVIRRFNRRRNAYGLAALALQTSRPVRFLLLLVAVSVVTPNLNLPAWAVPPLHHALQIFYIVALAWLAIAIVEILNSLVKHRLGDDISDNVRARRTRTQVHLLRQIVAGIILFGAFAAILMTFPYIRSIGAGLFASAGLAGLALGMAARPTLGNLIAGVQIALTEPIRIGDSVVVEGEWGHVAEVNTTYVIVRLWDLRHLIVPLSYFIEKPFQNWTRYSSDLIGAVFIYADYTVPVDLLRAEYQQILESSPLWDRKTMAVQVTNAKESCIEIRFLMSAANPSAAFDLRCHVREKLVAYLRTNHPGAFPRVRWQSSVVEPPA